MTLADKLQANLLDPTARPYMLTRMGEVTCKRSYFNSQARMATVFAHSLTEARELFKAAGHTVYERGK